MESKPRDSSSFRRPGFNKKSQKKDFRCSVVNDFALSLIYLGTIDEVVWYIANEVSSQMGLNDCVVYLYDDVKEVFVTRAAYGNKNPWGDYIKNPLEIPLGKGIVGSVGKNGIPEVIKDTRLDPRYVHDIEDNLSEMAIPIIYENTILGVIDSEHPESDFFTDAHIMSMSTISAMASTRIMNIRNKEKLEKHQENLEREIEFKTKELKNTIESLNRSNKDLESFAFAISHDLREPLRTIKGFLQIITSSDEEFSPNTETYMNYVIDGATRMNEMMEGLLEYSRLNYSSTMHQEIDMNEIIPILLSGLQLSIEEKNARVLVGDLPSFTGNKTQIMQLFQNLISNAIKFNKKGETPLVEITAKEDKKKIIFIVEDYGKGIPDVMQKHIFNLFYKSRDDSNKGSGIGLALCKKIVEYHEGEIEVQSVENRGTKFIITIPKR